MSGVPRRTPHGLPERGRCLVMGVINVTPDSFSDGGRWLDPEDALRHGLDLVADGADLVDVGGESTRPGAIRIDAVEEIRRVVPVVAGLAREGVLVSVDTMRAEVAESALAAGASVVNDVSGGRADPRMLSVAAATDVPFVVMHWRQHSERMQAADHTSYDDLVSDILAEMRRQIERARDAGVRDEHLVVDPGLGFSKTGEQNWTVLHRLEEFHALGYPLLVAASRKRFLGELLADGDGLRPTDRREDATAATSTLSAAAGAWCVRVHDVRPSVDAVRVAARWARG